MKKDYTVFLTKKSNYENIALPKINYSSHPLSITGGVLIIANALFFVLIEFAALMSLFLLNKSITDFLSFLKGFGHILFLFTSFPFLVASNNIAMTFIISIIILLLSVLCSIFVFVSNKTTIWAFGFLIILGIASVCLIIVPGAILLGLTLFFIFPGYILRRKDIKKKIKDNQVIINCINNQNMGEGNYSAFNKTKTLNNFNKTKSFAREDIFNSNTLPQNKITKTKTKNILKKQNKLKK